MYIHNTYIITQTHLKSCCRMLRFVKCKNLRLARVEKKRYIFILFKTQNIYLTKIRELSLVKYFFIIWYLGAIRFQRLRYMTCVAIAANVAAYVTKLYCRSQCSVNHFWIRITTSNNNITISTELSSRPQPSVAFLGSLLTTTTITTKSCYLQIYILTISTVELLL